MSLYIDNDELIIEVPNSEAPISAQHYGIADKTVGSFYMSEKYKECYDFFNGFNGDFYFDIGFTLRNSKGILDILKKRGLINSFKSKLKIQFDSIVALEWYIAEEKCNYYLMTAPKINEQKKYLKINNLDQVFRIAKNLLLGDLTKLVFKRIGTNGFIMYIDKSNDFDKMVEDGTVFKWGVNYSH